jgi:RNA polymerase primary sigma factor
MAQSSEFASVAKYLGSLNGYPPLNREEERALAVRVKAGDEQARELLVRHNLPFVVAVCRKYLGRGARLDDLIQEGNLGLLKAIDRFDTGMGTRFSTYAIWWVRAYVTKYLKDIRSSVRGGEGEGRVFQRDVSLDAAVGEESDTTYLDRIESPDPGPESAAVSRQTDQEVREALARVRKRLGDLGWQIVNDRLVQDSPQTLADIGKRFGVSRERVRQVEMRTRTLLARYLKASMAPSAAP